MSRKTHDRHDHGHSGDVTFEHFDDYRLFIGNDHPNRYHGPDSDMNIVFGRGSNDHLVGGMMDDEFVGGAGNMGKVGTGWSRTDSSRIRKKLDTVVSAKSKLTKPIRKPKATWVEPRFYAEVEYRDITTEGLLRASSFKGLSDSDKPNR